MYLYEKTFCYQWPILKVKLVQLEGKHSDYVTPLVDPGMTGGSNEKPLPHNCTPVIKGIIKGN